MEDLPINNEVETENILEEQEEYELIEDFNGKLELFYKKVHQDFNLYKTNPVKNMLSSFKNKYKFTKKSKKIRKDTDISNIKGRICTILRNPYFHSYTMNQKRHILNYCIKKIRGVYKHTQSKKTGYCNLQIKTGILEHNTIMFCLTKNTLVANKQWSQRLIDNLKLKISVAELKKKVMVISSKKDDLNGHATHFKNFDSACTQFHTESTFKIVFLCGNKTRIRDIQRFAEFFGMFNDNNKLKKNIRILHDEAHNPMEGVPPYRAIIENILIKKNVLSYTPVSATARPISEENNPMWITENLEKYALDYRKYDNTLSTDENYSSLSDANKITIEELKKHENWKDYGITEFPEEQYKEIYPEQSSNDVQNKRQLGFCQWPSIKDEQEEVNIGLNIINLNEIIDNHYESDKFNMHIVVTRCRKILIDYLSKKAVRKDYNPIVLSLYGGKVVIRYKKNQRYKINRTLFDKCNSGEFNDSLSKLFCLLKEKKITKHDVPKRPIIIIGNYKTTGESITFVNYKYGTVKCVVKILPTNAEEDNQSYSRKNFMIDLFVRYNPAWEKPKTFIIGHEQSINNALEYELENDQRIKDFETRDPTDISIMPNISEHAFNDNTNENSDNVSVPVKITVDRSDEGILKILEITSKRSRSEEDKNEIMNILNQLVHDDESDCSIEDPTGDFDFNKFTLNQLRCYKKKEKRETKKSQYKFTSYCSHHGFKTPFMNDKNSHKVGECEMTICHDKYIVRKDCEIVEQNSKNIWWLSYKY